MNITEKQKALREGLAPLLCTVCGRAKENECAPTDWRETGCCELPENLDTILAFLSEHGCVLKVEGEKVHLVSLTGSVSVGEKAAYLLGVSDCTEQFKAKGLTATAPLQEAKEQG